MKKKCELCSQSALMYCESDQASLCYDCDRNVHSANFLVAKHSRTLLCHKCQSPTPWIASGVDLGRAASLCVKCLDENSSQRRLLLEGESSRRRNDVVEEICDSEDLDEESDAETEDDDGEYSDVSKDEDEDGENQVVPWSSVASPPVTASSSSSSEEFSSSRFSSESFRSGIKRERLDADVDSEDDSVCSSERFSRKSRTEIDKTVSLRSFSPLKLLRSDRVGDQSEA